MKNFFFFYKINRELILFPAIQQFKLDQNLTPPYIQLIYWDGFSQRDRALRKKRSINDFKSVAGVDWEKKS